MSIIFHTDVGDHVEQVLTLIPDDSIKQVRMIGRPIMQESGPAGRFDVMAMDRRYCL